MDMLPSRERSLLKSTSSRKRLVRPRGGTDDAACFASIALLLVDDTRKTVKAAEKRRVDDDVNDFIFSYLLGIELQ